MGLVALQCDKADGKSFGEIPPERRGKIALCEDTTRWGAIRSS